MCMCKVGSQQQSLQGIELIMRAIAQFRVCSTIGGSVFYVCAYTWSKGFLFSFRYSVLGHHSMFGPCEFGTESVPGTNWYKEGKIDPAPWHQRAMTTSWGTQWIVKTAFPTCAHYSYVTSNSDFICSLLIMLALSHRSFEYTLYIRSMLVFFGLVIFLIVWYTCNKICIYTLTPMIFESILLLNCAKQKLSWGHSYWPTGWHRCWPAGKPTSEWRCLFIRPKTTIAWGERMGTPQRCIAWSQLYTLLTAKSVLRWYICHSFDIAKFTQFL